MVRQNNRGSALFMRDLSIFNTLDTFDDDRQIGDTLASVKWGDNKIRNREGMITYPEPWYHVPTEVFVVK